jgi:predicted thioesterase
VGSRIEVDHLAPTAVGAEVVAHAVVTGVEGRSISFDVTVDEGNSTVAQGSHVRVVVERVRFVSRLAGT